MENKILKKSIRKGLFIGLTISLISFFYGGIYTEMYIGGLEPSFLNFIYALIGSLIFGFIFYCIIFILSFSFLYIKEPYNKGSEK